MRVNLLFAVGVALATLFLVAAGGAEAGNRDLNLWPFLTVEKEGTNSDVRALIPLLEFRNDEEETFRAFRPLCLWRRTAEGDRSFDALWPMIHSSVDSKNNSDWRALPFLGWDHSDERGFALAPLYWQWSGKGSRDSSGLIVGPAYRTHDGSERYTGLIPLGGSWKDSGHSGFWIASFYHEADLLGVEEKNALFPFWSTERDGNKRSLWVMPFYRSWDGDKVTQTVIAPLYWAGDDYAVLFPFLWMGDETLIVFPVYWAGEGYTVVFPVYGQYRGKDESWTFFLWPTYMESKHDDYIWRSFFFPIFARGSDGGKNSEAWVWPLAGFSHENEPKWKEDSYWALWPLVWHSSSESSLPRYPGKSTNTTVFPFFFSGTRKPGEKPSDANPRAVMREHNWNYLLPLYTYDRDKKGEAFTMMWPLWRTAWGEDEEQYSFLWRVADARYYPNGDKRVSVLWRGYRNEVKGDLHKMDIFPFMSYRSEGDDARFQFMGGLFEKGKESGKPYVRLLYWPR